jgi:FAD:protein FMN transferase
VVTSLPIAAVEKAVDEQLEAFDEAFSNWRDDSEIRRVNAHASTEPLAVSARFGGVLQQALLVAEATQGAFDPTMKPLSELYRTAKQHPELGLEDEQLQAAKQRVGYQLVSLANGKLTKQRADVQLDLDGIVAGAAVDAIAAALQKLGIESFYLQVTGEVLCRGVKPDGTVWRIGVVNPASDIAGGQTAIVTLPLRDRALCSSGDYRNAVIVAGRVVHHLFDPRTGRNPEHSVVSASVLARSCAVADALGTALMVMGEEQTRQLWPGLQQLGAEGALLLKPGDDNEWVQMKIDWPAEDA